MVLPPDAASRAACGRIQVALLPDSWLRIPPGGGRIVLTCGFWAYGEPICALKRPLSGLVDRECGREDRVVGCVPTLPQPTPGLVLLFDLLSRPDLCRFCVGHSTPRHRRADLVGLRARGSKTDRHRCPQLHGHTATAGPARKLRIVIKRARTQRLDHAYNANICDCRDGGWAW